MLNKQIKFTSFVVAALVLGSGCAQKKAPELDELTLTKIQRDQAQLQALQSAANPVLDDVKKIQEDVKKRYPGYHLDLTTQKLVQDGSGQNKK